MHPYKVLIEPRSDCVSNLMNASIIYHYIIENGHRITNDVSDADFIIVISCGVVKSTQESYIRKIKGYNNLKKKDAKVIIFGCLVKINRKLVDTMDAIPISYSDRSKLDDFFYSKIKIEKVEPYCDEKLRNDLVSNTKDALAKIKFRNKIFQYIFEYRQYLLLKLFSKFSKKIREKNNLLYESIEFRDRFFVEISRGCNGNCSYCVIKKAKGNSVSRKEKDILLDIEKLYSPSKSLFLVADDCASYGSDIGSDLPDLINKINKKFPNLTIDINYLNPTFLERNSEKYLNCFRKNNIGLAIIPIESGSNKILKNMNRPYDIKNAIKIVKQIKKISPETLIASDFIIGFPGENIIDFLKTIAASKHFNFHYSLTYSENEGTPSSFLPGKKSSFTKNYRWIIFLVFTNLIVLYTALTHTYFKK